MAGDRYKDEKFVGWLKVNLSLIFAKEGVEKFSDDEVQALYNKIKRNIPSSAAPGPHTLSSAALGPHNPSISTPGPHTPSSSATGPPALSSGAPVLHTCNDKKKLTGEWAKGKFSCQADHCDLWLEEIRKEYLGSPASVVWDNCNRAQLSSDAWACAKLFMPNGSASYTCAKDADIAALLTLLLKCCHFSNFFSSMDVCKKVKAIRNRLMHTGDMKLEATTVQTDIQTILELLEDPKYLQHQQGCKDAVIKIKELQSGKTEISLNKELELRVLNTELRNLVNVVDALETKVQDTSVDVTSNTGELDKLKADHNQLNTELALVKSRSDVFNQFIADYKIKGVSTEKLAEVSNKIASLETQIQAQLKELTDRMDKLEIQFKTLTQKQVSHKLKLDQLATDVNKEQGSQRQKLDKLETGHSAISKEQGSQRQKLDKLETGHFSISQEQGSQRQKLDQLETNVNKEMGSQRQKLDKLETGHSAVSKEQGSHRQMLDKLETGHSAISKEQGSQRQKLDKLETGHSAISKEQGSQRQKLDKLETGHSAVSKEQGSQRQKLDKLEADISQKQGSQKQRLDELETNVSKEQGSTRRRLDELETGHLAVSQEQGCQRQRLDDLEMEKQVNREMSIEDMQGYLISLYSKHSQKIPIFPLRPSWKQTVASLFVLPSMKVTDPLGLSEQHMMTRIDNEPGTQVTSIQDIFLPATSSCMDIYIMGDAGTGKSTLCEYLVHLWVNGHTSSSPAPDSEEKFMQHFKLLFYLSLREATSCNIEDMIKSQLLLEDVNVSRLLYDHCSLIILDGLDEYSLKQTSKTRFGSENVPYRRHWDKCTVLTTSRPWKLELITKELEDKIDRQISIIGLNTETQKKLIIKVVDLLNLKKKRNKNPADFITAVKTQKLDKLMVTPIMLMQMIGLWFSGQHLGGSRCSIYAQLIDKQIQFTEEVRGLPADPPLQGTAQNMPEMKCDDETSCSTLDQFSTFFKNYTYIMNNKSLVQKVCRFAYCSLSSKDRENSLVFSHEQMEIFDLTREDILLCLHLGLLTQYKVFGEITELSKSLSFVHKSFQELFAAIYLSQIDQADELKTLLERDFTNLEHILEMGTVFIFVCGMNPTVASGISKFIMSKVSGDARLEQYRQYGKDWFNIDSALVKQLQGLILDGIEEGRDNGHEITDMQLQDLYMNATDKDISPARVLSFISSLDLFHVKSLYMIDQGAIFRDGLQQLLQEKSLHLQKLVLMDTVVSVDMIQAVVRKQQGTLQVLGLINTGVKSIDVSHLNQNDLQTLLSAPRTSLSLHGLVLSHSQLKFLFQHVSNSCYVEVWLGGLKCTTHGYRGNECKHRLDLSANRNLSRLRLYNLPVEEVLVVPENLVWCIISDLQESVAISIISGLKRAEKLEILRCGGLRGSAVVELAATLPHLLHLQHLILSDIDLSGQQQVVQAVAKLKTLENIHLYSVTIREEDLRELLSVLPSSRRASVQLGTSNGKFPVTITGYNRHTGLLDQIRHDPHTRVISDEVKIEGNTCIVKYFRYYTKK